LNDERQGDEARALGIGCYGATSGALNKSMSMR
jgi:hypothetical protein